MDSFRIYAWLWLLVLPIIPALIWYRSLRRFRHAATYSSISDLKSIPITFMQRMRRLLPWVYGLGLCLIVIALARPQSGKSESRISGEGIAIEVVLDVSGSMEALDFQIDGNQVNRLEAVKHVVSEFILGS